MTGYKAMAGLPIPKPTQSKVEVFDMGGYVLAAWRPKDIADMGGLL